MSQQQEAFNQIALTLGKHFDNLYYVDLETSHYSTHVSLKQFDEIKVPKEGDDFFAEAKKIAAKYVHPDDLDECIMNALQASDTAEMLKNEFETQRLIIDEYCLGYPLGMKASQVYMAAQDVNVAGFETMNEYVDFTQISFK